MPRQHELESFWSRCFERPTNAHGHIYSDAFNAASDVEAMLWLHYGVELSLYSQIEAQDIFESNRNRLLHSMQVVMGGTIQGFFPPVLSTLMGESSRSGAIFDVRYTDRLSSDVVNTVALGMLFNEVARACSNPVSSVFSDLITFGLEDEWRALMEQDVNPEQILRGEGEKVDIVVAGYFASLDHMGAMDELLQYCSDELAADSPALRDSQGDQTFLMLGDRTRSIHAWRLKLDDPVTQNRFTDLTNKLGTLLESDIELGPMGFNSENLFSVVQSLGARWLGDYGFTLRGLRAA
jgi:hypothetical protein